MPYEKRVSSAGVVKSVYGMLSLMPIPFKGIYFVKKNLTYRSLAEHFEFGKRALTNAKDAIYLIRSIEDPIRRELTRVGSFAAIGLQSVRFNVFWLHPTRSTLVVGQCVLKPFFRSAVVAKAIRTLFLFSI